ncbi:GNAT family N-acetyltransferase [Shewanella intestini]|uniref:GNAT family N-acetyltransferase n=1 Tax=Shewanella intestini TaxID=2017544 RepID=A0ABS5I1V8_9GAMM|nr:MULTISPECIES: GNAT family N-acetyltransferase [Shewanella]MBR9727987.1 GNAT family N-acetyltransferase [Shewanella intestini]MRG36462.1 GNAT family N-acetyltransferase [Shewanella sp. XMDDZSB0408]
MQIRLGNASDLTALVQFNQAMALETENLQLDTDTLTRGVKGMLEHPERGFYLVAEQDLQILGSLMVTFEWSDWRAQQYYWVQSVYVTPQHRRKGVYAKLYQYVKQLAQTNGDGDCFRLYVEHDNHIAQQTYKKLGMSQSHYLMFEQ